MHHVSIGIGLPPMRKAAVRLAFPSLIQTAQAQAAAAVQIRQENNNQEKVLC